MEKDYLPLKRAPAPRFSSEWKDDDYDVLADGAVVGRIFKANAAPVGMPWMWALIMPHHEGRSPTHGYAATREAAMSAFAKSWAGIELSLPLAISPRFSSSRIAQPSGSAFGSQTRSHQRQRVRQQTGRTANVRFDLVRCRF